MMQRFWNRQKSFVQMLSRRYGVSSAVLLAIWEVESSGNGFLNGRLVIRMELHHLWRLWGKNNETKFKQFFSFSRGKQPWLDHRYRNNPSGPYVNLHVNQSREWECYELAVRITGDENLVCACCSFGGPQIMGFNAQKLGYRQPIIMRSEFSISEGHQLDGLMRYLKLVKVGNRTLLEQAKKGNWLAVAEGYNGSGQTRLYATKLRQAYERAKQLVGNEEVPQEGDKTLQDVLIDEMGESVLEGEFGRIGERAGRRGSAVREVEKRKFFVGRTELVDYFRGEAMEKIKSLHKSDTVKSISVLGVVQMVMSFVLLFAWDIVQFLMDNFEMAWYVALGLFLLPYLLGVAYIWLTGIYHRGHIKTNLEEETWQN